MSIKSIDVSDVQRITSGQVIIDLVSIVKELVENSIDAQCSKIEIIFKNNGLDSIEVIDDGSGIERDDFKYICLKHHTSKLFTFEQLSQVCTLGFRGEALSSLSSISNLKITTCTKKDYPRSTELEFSKMGELVNQKTKVGGLKGTSILITNLFHNLPVRSKNLQKNIKKEFTKAVNFLTNYLLIHPEIRFTIYNISKSNKKTLVLGTQGTKSSTILDTMINVFGSNGSYGLVPIDLNVKDVEVKFKLNTGEFPIKRKLDVQFVGYISNCSFGLGRSSSDRQYLFINKRPIILKKFIRTINEVYKSFNHVQFPVVVLNFVIDSEFLDINITPDKRVVMIQNENMINDVLRDRLITFFKEQNNVIPKNKNKEININGEQISILSKVTNKSESSDVTNSSSITRISFIDESRDISEAKSQSEGQSIDEAAESIIAKRDYQEKAPNIDEKLQDTQINFEQEKEKEQASKGKIEIELEEQELPKELINEKERDEDIGEVRNKEIDEDITKERIDGGIINGNSINCNNHGIENGSTLGSTLSSNRNETQIGAKEIVEPAFNPSHHNDEKLDYNLYISSLDATADDRSDNASVLDKAAGDLSQITKGEKARIESGSDSNPDMNLQSLRKEKIDHTYLKRSRPETKQLNDSVSDRIVPEGPIKRIKIANVSERPPTSIDQTISNNRSYIHNVSTTLNIDLNEIKKTIKKEKSLSGAEVYTAGEVKVDKIELKEEAEEKLAYIVSKHDFLNMKVIGQFNLGFILVTLNSSNNLFIIDQHASDEKYNFERLTKATQFQSQPLVIPRIIELNVMDELIVIDNLEIFKRNGFIINFEENNSPGKRIKLISLPISKNTIFDLNDFHELIHLINTTKTTNNQFIKCSKIRSILAMRSCRTSIMIGQHLNKKTMKRIVTNLSSLDKPWNCPHGRPTMRHLIELQNWSTNKEDYRL